MTARELIQTLQNLPAEEQDLEVRTEGCDCTGDVAKVVTENGLVMLCRTDGFLD